MGRSLEVFNGSIPFALARQVVEWGCGMREPRDVITKEITRAQIRQDLLDSGRPREIFYGLHQFGSRECLAIAQLITQELATGPAPTALGDRDLEAVLIQAGKDCPNGSHVLGPGDGVDHHIVQENLAKSAASVRVEEITQDTIRQTLKVGGTVGEAHAKALVLAEAEAARVETSLVAVLRVEQDNVERALQIDGSEELGVSNLCDEVFCSRKGPAVLSGLGIDTPHVNAKAGVPIFLGHKGGLEA